MSVRVFLFICVAFAAAACAPPSPQQPALRSAAPAFVFGSRLLDDTRILAADDMEGRRVGSAGGARARTFLLDRLGEIGVAPAAIDGFEHGFETRRESGALNGVNLVGKVEGVGASDRAILVMAHYDHVGVRGGVVYNGADDNASGTASLLAVAESLMANRPQHDVFLALLDGEEGGLSGARALVADPQLGTVLQRTALAINLDMMSRSDRGELYAAGAYHWPGLRPHLEALAASAPVTLKLGHDDPALGRKDDWTMQSDHGAFHAAGKPWVYFGVEDHPDYHRPTDDFEAIDQDFFRRATLTAERAVRAFDQELDSINLEPRRVSP